MPINSDKPHLWKTDVEESVDTYNDWFIRFAPKTYRSQREATSGFVTKALEQTDYLRKITPAVLVKHPEILSTLRMVCAPPLARDRLIGLSHSSKNLVISMEGKPEQTPKIPPRMSDDTVLEHLRRICDTIVELIDGDLFPWIECAKNPTKEEVRRAATVTADRVCGATSDPIIRNAQEQRQLACLKRWLDARGYQQIPPGTVDSILRMKPGSYAFRMNVPVGTPSHSVNMPMDCVIQPHDAEAGRFPVLIEAKSAGDATNTNKRRKEEAQKYSQIKARYGRDIQFLLLLCGYFEPGYLGYEASEGIDWVWEHRINDLEAIIPRSVRPKPSSRAREDSPPYGNLDSERETIRLQSQTRVDARKSQETRNRLGQFSTPFPLAKEIVAQALSLLSPRRDLAFLEPAVGTGVFFSAIEEADRNGDIIRRALGVEVDSGYGQVAQELWNRPPFQVRIEDFLDFSADRANRESFDLICTNPPYVRHHHIETRLKQELQARVKNEVGIQASGLSGLYVYFVLLCDAILRDGAVASWLIPSEFLYVNYGKALREYFTEKVTLLHVHQFDPVDVQFADALVSSCVVTYRKQSPRGTYDFRYTFGGTLSHPNEDRTLSSDEAVVQGKWNLRTDAVPQIASHSTLRVSDLFDIKRGIATGNNGFFMLDRKMIEKFSVPDSFLRPILPSPRTLSELTIESDENGVPILPDARFLLDCRLPPEVVRVRYPHVWDYLLLGEAEGIPDAYLCSRRKPWYLQERRETPLFLATYMARSRSADSHPFRFFLNLSLAVATNVFLLLYPKHRLRTLLGESRERMTELLQLLNSLEPSSVLNGGRTYGGGLHKLEPSELAGLPLSAVPDWVEAEVDPEIPIAAYASF